MNIDIHLQIDEKDISLNALAKLILRLNATSADATSADATSAESAESAKTATEQVAESAAMGTHSTVPESAKTATEQVADTTPAESAKIATEQVAESAAMGTHSTPAESAKTAAKSATEQVAESTPVPETTFAMFADPEPDTDKMTAIREKLRAIAKNGRRDEAKAVMLKYRVPALSKLDSLTDEELSSMFNEVMAL